MKTEQRTYERLVLNHESGCIDVYHVPMPEAVPVHSWISTTLKAAFPVIAAACAVVLRARGAL